MWKTYFKVAVRNLLRNRIYAAINIVGLAAGIACSIIVFLYLQNELSYDLPHENHDRIYRLGTVFRIHDKIERLALSSRTMGPMIKEEFPDIQEIVRMSRVPRVQLNTPDTTLFAEGLMLADSTVFDVFSHKLIYGDPKTALRERNAIVLTASLAKSLFGTRNPVGDSINVSNRMQYYVTGVMEDLPDNVHHQFSALISLHTMKGYAHRDLPDLKISLWSATDLTFALFPPNYDIRKFTRWWPTFYQRHMAVIGHELSGQAALFPEKLRDIHMNPRLHSDPFSSGNRSYLWAFSAIGLFILVLACINYMNMATARSTTRRREVGLRKVMGAGRAELIGQFLGESLLIAFMALLLALCFVEIVLELTPFNAMLN
ncbi:MAG: ABC transporter permease, partial [Bacteroidota bacterium]